MFKRIVSIILVILWIIAIAYFSNSNSIVSGKQSRDLLKSFITNALKALKTIGIYKKEITPKNVSKLITLYHPFFRKLCHFVVYLILAFFFSAMINNNISFKKKWVVIISVVFCIFISILDELNQTRVLGRIGDYKDSIIDTSGSILGVFFYFLFHNIKNRIVQRKKRKCQVA